MFRQLGDLPVGLFKERVADFRPQRRVVATRWKVDRWRGATLMDDLLMDDLLMDAIAASRDSSTACVRHRRWAVIWRLPRSGARALICHPLARLHRHG